MIKYDTNYKKNCIKCNKEFFKNYCTSKSEWFGNKRRPNGTQYCSKLCCDDLKKGKPPHNKGKKGKPHSDQWKQMMMQLWHERRENSEYKKFSGSKWSNTRKHVLRRDDYTCQECWHKEPDIMTVDHILPKSTYPELMYKSENCITLCPNCHQRKTIYEKKNKLHRVGCS